MSKQSNQVAVWLNGLIVFLTLVVGSNLKAQPPTADTPPSWLKDAELTDVFFLNSQLGWAVGEHGTILRTNNGGATWNNTANLQTVTDRDLNLQGDLKRVFETLENNLGQAAAPQTRAVATGINFRFESVHFSDAKNGIVVGGYDVPYLDRSRAIVMRTLDGGTSWKVIGGLVIPRLAKVRMDNEASIWAVGDASNLNPAGIYSSSDGGASWSNQSNKLAGSFVDAARTGPSVVAVDSNGQLVVIRGDESEQAVVLGVDVAAPICRVDMVDAQTGWAVGYGGQVLQTRNGGASWRAISSITLQTESKIDFQAMTFANGKLWCAGNPGSYIISIDLETGAVTRHRTPSTTALNSIVFSTSTHGWAVGDCGNILATNDGGQTWQVQRSAYQRVALMGVSFGAESLPLTSLAVYAGESNLATASVCVAFDRDEFPAATGRLHQATSRIGCNVSRILYPGNANQAEQALRQLTLAIRTLRPNAIVCESPAIRSSNGVLDPHNLLERAIQAAADRQQYSDQLVELGLSIWQVDRLAVFDSTGLSELKVNSDRFLPMTGQSIEDYVAISAAIVGMPIMQSQEKSFVVKQFSLARSFRGSDLFDGLRQMGRQVPSRVDANTRRGNLQLMQQNVSRLAQIKELGQWQDHSANSLMVWYQRLNQIIGGQDKDLSGVWLAKLANVYMKAGKWQMAEATLNQLVARYENHPLTPAAMLWLAQYYASDEMLAERILVSQVDEIPDSIEDELLDLEIKTANYQTQAQTFQSEGMTHMVWVPDQVRKEAEAEQAANGLAAPKVDQATESYQQASAIVSKIRSRDPDLARDRNLRFLEAKLTSRVQSSIAAQNLFQQLMRGNDEEDPILVASSREIKLGKARPEPYQGMVCVTLTDRPKLDGDLSDECWNTIMNDGKANFFRMTPPGKMRRPRPMLSCSVMIRNSFT